MTVSSTNDRNDYIGTGAVDTYSYTFRIFDETDLRVTVRDTDGVESTLAYPDDYSVTGVGSASGGSITLTAGDLADDYSLSIRRVLPLLQSTDIRNQGAFFPEIHEDQFDRSIMIDQQQQDEIDRSLKAPETDPGELSLPGSSDRANKFLAFDEDGAPFAADTVGTGVPVSAFALTLLDDTTAAEARATLGAIGLADLVARGIYVTDPPYSADATFTVSATTPIQDALNAAGVMTYGATVFVPPGRYKATDNLSIPSNVALVGVPGRSILDFSAKSSRANCLTISGTAGSNLLLTANAAFEATSVSLSLSDAATLAAGDLITISSDQKDAASHEGFRGEFAHIESVSGTTVNLREKLRYSYATASNAKVQKITPKENVTIEGITLVGTEFQYTSGGAANGDHGVDALWCTNLKVKDCKFRDVARMAVRINSCLGWEVSGCDIEMPKEETTAQILYGICWLNYASDGRIYGNRVNGGRHGIVHSEDTGYGTSFNVSISNNNVYGTYAAGLSTHSRMRNGSWVGNTVENCWNGIDLRTPNHVVAGNTFVNGNNAVGGIGVALGELAGDIIFSGNLWKNWRIAGQVGDRADNYAMDAVSFVGNEFVDCTSGLFFDHLGGLNSDGTTYNTTLYRRWAFKGNTFSGGTSQQLRLRGYFEECDITGNSFSFPDVATGNYGVFLSGARKCLVQGNMFRRSLGTLEGSVNVTDGAGATVSRAAENNIYKGNTAFDHSSTTKLCNGLVASSRYSNGNMNVGRDTATIAAGAISAENEYMVVDTEGAAATDDLDTITGVGYGQMLTIRSANSLRDITLKHATGNLLLGADFVLNTNSDTITLVYQDSFWRRVASADNG